MDQNFAGNIFKFIFKNENWFFGILMQISLTLVPKGPMNDKSSLVQMALDKCDKPLSEPVMP